MKIRALLACLLFLAGCGLQNKIDRNTDQMEKTSQAIQENTQEIHRSTQTMRRFPLLFVVLLIFLLIPIYVLINLYRKNLSKKSKSALLKDLFLP
jgi:hypothetical protein